MSLLTLCQDVCAAVNLPRPAAIVGSSDDTARKLLSLAQEELRSLAAAGQWQELTKEGTFASVNGTESYALSTIASDLDYIVSDTLWNRTLREPVKGPLTSQEWQAQKSFATTSPFKQFRVVGGAILLYPTPTEAHNYAFDYITKNRCQSAGGTAQERWQADTDTSVIDEFVVFLGLRYRLLKSIGMAYADEFAEYEAERDKRLGRTKVAPTLQMRPGVNFRAGVAVPEGNWPVS